MSIEFTLSDGELWNLQPGLPPEYAEAALKGAAAQSAKTNFGEVILQQLFGDGYSLCYSIGKFFKRVSLSGSIKKQGLYSCFMLKNDVRKEIEGVGKLHVRQDQYTCFFTGPTNCKVKFEKNTKYQAVDLFYSPQLLHGLTPFFPEMKEHIGSRSAILPGGIRWSLPSMQEIINHLLNCSYDESTKQFYFDLKVRELLYQMLENAFKSSGKEYHFTPWEIKRIHDVRSILESYISKKPPLMRSLSKQVALNEFKLKTGFKQYFNSGMFEWLMEQKMQYAKTLLLTTNKPIKDICTMVGYPRSTNFITAFRRHFGMTPASLRR